MTRAVQSVDSKAGAESITRPSKLKDVDVDVPGTRLKLPGRERISNIFINMCGTWIHVLHESGGPGTQGQTTKLFPFARRGYGLCLLLQPGPTSHGLSPVG